MVVASEPYVEQIKEMARKEGLEESVLARRVREGRVVVPCNPVHGPRACGIGEGLSVKVNVNIGTSRDRVEVEEELEKVRLSLEYGADAIMDLSTGGDIDAIRRQIIAACPVPVGTVPIYQTGLRMARQGALVDMDEDDIFNGIVQHAKDGVDFMTVHCGITKEAVERAQAQPPGHRCGLPGRVLPGGVDPAQREGEPPLRELRLPPGAGQGARVRPVPGRRVPTRVHPRRHGRRPGPGAPEPWGAGPAVPSGRGAGHGRGSGPRAHLDQIETNVRLEKSVCDGAPFYVLGPLVTDIAPGYDHITARHRGRPGRLPRCGLPVLRHPCRAPLPSLPPRMSRTG